MDNYSVDFDKDLRDQMTPGFDYMTPNMSHVCDSSQSNFNDSLFDGMYNPDQKEEDFAYLSKFSNHSSKVIRIEEKSDKLKYLVLFLFCCS